MIHLQIQNLTRGYGKTTVLKDLSVTVHRQVVGISGANGSGKSTLLRCLAGLLKPERGDIIWTVDGTDMSVNDLHGQVGYTAPYVELYEGLTVMENLTFLSQLHRSGRPDASRLAEILRQFEASVLSDHLYGDLSTGQRQRIKLAASILHNPRLLCLDEPGSNLDEKGRNLVHSLIQNYTEKHRMILIASNQPEELESCDVIINLDERFSP